MMTMMIPHHASRLDVEVEHNFTFFLNMIVPQQAASLDAELIDLGYSIQQLMEHAGLVVALAITRKYSEKLPVLVICGPGNNGGDGLVCARYLMEFGYKDVSILFPAAQPPPGSGLRAVSPATKLKPHIQQQLTLVKNAYDISVYTDKPVSELITGPTIVVDAIVGFGSKGPLREPYNQIVQDLNNQPNILIACVDCPSGWDVENGPVPSKVQIQNPDLVISLTAPKPFATHLTCSHCVGGRFIPQKLKEKYGLENLVYPKDDELLMWLRK